MNNQECIKHERFCQFRREIRGSKEHLIVGIDIAKDKHYAFFGTSTGKILFKRLIFDNNLEGPQHIIQGLKLKTSNFKLQLVEPVGYLEMVYLLKRCIMVMTDSGGLQKKSYFFGKPCVTLRDETEWVELVEHGCNSVAGTDAERIYSCYKEMMKKQIDFNLKLYGEGEAGRKIVNILV